jgi:hypothetical protein
MTRGTTVKMIQLRTVALLLAAGIFGSAGAQANKPDTQRQVAKSGPKTQQTQIVKPAQHDRKDHILYAWDRVGKPIDRESFLI